MFDAKTTVMKLRQETRLRRKRPYRRNQSRLDRFRVEILALKHLALLPLKFSVG